MSTRARHNVSVSGPAGAPAMVFAHGFGCDQSMWRLVAPAFEDGFRVVLFDHAGSGTAQGPDGQRREYDPEEYVDLQRFATDVVDILDELAVDDAVFWLPLGVVPQRSFVRPGRVVTAPASNAVGGLWCGRNG